MYILSQECIQEIQHYTWLIVMCDFSSCVISICVPEDCFHWKNLISKVHSKNIDRFNIVSILGLFSCLLKESVKY